MKKAFILLNGEKPEFLPDLSTYDVISATDGAYTFLENNKITPHFICGDFDSLKTLPSNISTYRLPDQNYTDFEKAIQILIDKKVTHLDVYGASGKEHDHFIGHLHIAHKFHEKLRISFYDNHSKYFLFKKHLNLNIKIGRRLSIIPINRLEKAVSSGLKYNLTGQDLDFTSFISTRNEAISSKVELTATKGTGVCFIQRV